MPLEMRWNDGRLVWIRNPFTGTVTYFTHLHRKRDGFARPKPAWTACSPTLPPLRTSFGANWSGRGSGAPFAPATRRQPWTRCRG